MLSDITAYVGLYLLEISITIVTLVVSYLLFKSTKKYYKGETIERIDTDCSIKDGITITDMYIYPVKSCKRIQIQAGRLCPTGIGKCVISS